MKNIFAGIFLTAIGALAAHADITIEECVRKAEANYPLIKKYELLSATTQIELSDINKSWLPRIGVYGQVTGQNVVPSFPGALKSVLTQMGSDMKGLGKIQYKVGVDVSQTIWDGGVSSTRRELSRSREEAQKASNDVEMYAVRERVENLYFAILLTDEQIAQNMVTETLLESNLERLRAMHRNGTAMQSDVDMVEAQTLTLKQNISLARHAVEGYRELLSLFAGEDLKNETLLRPSADEPVSDESLRPEIGLFESQRRFNALSDRLTKNELMPKVGFFAQAYYGYPGIDYFKSMVSRDLSFNLLAGVKVSWNVDAFYTRKNSTRRTQLNAQNIATDLQLFLFNTGLQTSSQRSTISGLRDVMNDDARIIELRANVRKAAESQLANGVIDATALLTKISDENLARLTAQFHETQLLKEIYILKYTLNR
ncbi:MAG: TolC family protein [Duncaniella sp.]|nr:TolC family protein [Duncaniella sp.]